MKTRWWMGLVLAAALMGALITLVAEQTYWDHELKAQLAEKEQLVSALRADLVSLRGGLATVQKTNDDMRRLIDASMADADAVAKSNLSALEKLRGVIVRLQKLQAELKRP